MILLNKKIILIPCYAQNDVLFKRKTEQQSFSVLEFKQEGFLPASHKSGVQVSV